MTRKVLESQALLSIRRSPSVLEGLLLGHWRPLRNAARQLRRCRKIYLAGSGTSFHAALVGAFLLRKAGLDADAVGALEFSLYPLPLDRRDAVMVITHSGAKKYSLACLQLARRKQALTVGITGRGSPFPKCDVLLETVAQETSQAHTVSYIGSLFVLSQLALLVGGSEKTAQKILARIPTLIPALLEPMPEAGDRLARARRAVIIGAGPNAATASEAALKMIEMAHIPASGYELETFLHGPLAAVDRSDFVCPIVTQGPSEARSLQLVAALRQTGCRIWTVGNSKKIPCEIDLPNVAEELSPMLAAIPFQLLALEAAAVLGVDPDLNRKDDPRYRKAFAQYAS